MIREVLARQLSRTAIAAIGVAALLTFGAAKAADEVVFQWSWLPTGYYVPISAGVANGFFAEEDIELTIRTGRGSGDAVKKVAAAGDRPIFGDGDISALIVARIKEGAPVQCLNHVHNQSPHSLFVLESSGITSFADLEGKTLATTAGNSHRNYFPIVARAAGIDPESVKWVVVEAAAMASLLINKSVDGVPYFTSNISFVAPQAEAIGDKLVVLPFATQGFNIYAYCNYANEALIAANPGLVTRFVAATEKSYAWARDNPEEAARMHAERWPDTKYEDNLAGWLDLRANMFGQDGTGDWTGLFDAEKLKSTYAAVAEAQGLDPNADLSGIVADGHMAD